MDTTKRASCLPSLCCWMPANQRQKKDTKADAVKTPSYASTRNPAEPSHSFDGHSLKELMTGPISKNVVITVTGSQSSSEEPCKPDQTASTVRVEDKDFDPAKRDKPSNVIARESSVDPNTFEVIKMKQLFNWSNNTRWKKAKEPVTERSASDEESYKAKSVVSENNCASLSASFRRRTEHKLKKKLKPVEMFGSISDVVQRTGCLDTSSSKSLHTHDIPGHVGDVISCSDDKKVSEPTRELAKLISTVSAERVDDVGQFQEPVSHHESSIAIKSHSDISNHSAQESI